MTSEPAQSLSHYRLLEKIGEGGMGVVWKAQDSVLQRTVAIKVLPAELAHDEKRRQMFLEEARLASCVSDARIVQVYEIGRQENLDFIVMEYVEGQPLSRLLQGRPLPPEKVAALGEQVARALSRTHRKGLLHRDLKPANILVTAEGEVKVVDFGLATLYTQSASTVSTEPASSGASVPPISAESHGFAGTLAYMAPEQARGEALDPRSDIFSLGAVLYEMTTGQRPFAGVTRDETLREVLRARPVPVHERLPKVPLDLDRIIAKALAPQRDERYQTMEDLAVDLKHVGKELESGLSHSYEEVFDPWVRTRRRRALASGGILLLLVVLAVSWKAGLLARLFPAPVKVDVATLLIAPLEVRDSEEGAAYVGRAFAEALGANLAPARNLKILPVPHPPFASRPDLLAPAREARRLGAGRLLAGSLTRHGKSVQANLSLIDALEGRILWGIQRDTSEDLLPVLASTLARAVGEEMGGIFPKLYEVPEESPGGPELAASPLTTEALGAYRQSDWTGFSLATGKLVQAFPQEPDAHALRADALMKVYEGHPTDESRTRLEDAVASLCALDPRHFYCLSKPAYLLGRDGHARAAAMKLSEVLQRKDLSPSALSYVLGLRGQARRVAGDTDGALSDLEEAVTMSPTRSGTFFKLGETLRSVGRYEEALVRIRQAAALSPSNPLIQSTLGLTLINLNRAEEAVGPSRRACELSGSQPLCAGYAIALFKAGRAEQAVTAARQAEAMEGEGDGLYNLACYHALTGQKADALRLLRRAVDLGDVDSYMGRDPDLQPLRGDPRFESLLQEVQARLQAPAR